MPHHPTLEEGPGSDAFGAIDDLIGHHKVTRSDFLLETSHGGESNDGAHAERAKRGYVGAGGDLVGCELVVQAVSGEEGDGCRAARSRGGVVED